MMTSNWPAPTIHALQAALSHTQRDLDFWRLTWRANDELFLGPLVLGLLLAALLTYLDVKRQEPRTRWHSLQLFSLLSVTLSCTFVFVVTVFLAKVPAELARDAQVLATADAIFSGQATVTMPATPSELIDLHDKLEGALADALTIQRKLDLLNAVAPSGGPQCDPVLEMAKLHRGHAGFAGGHPQ